MNAFEQLVSNGVVMFKNAKLALFNFQEMNKG